MIQRDGGREGGEGGGRGKEGELVDVADSRESELEKGGRLGPPMSAISLEKNSIFSLGTRLMISSHLRARYFRFETEDRAPSKRA